MAYEVDPLNNPEGIDPELIQEINDVSLELWDSARFKSLEQQLFQQYYEGLSELNPEEVLHHNVEYELCGEMFRMVPVGDTPYGPLFEITKSSEGQDDTKGLFVFAGSIVLTSDFEALTNEQVFLISEVVRGSSPEDRTLLRFTDNKFGMFTKGLCDESYFVLFPAYTPSRLEVPELERGVAYSKFERYQYTGVKLKGSESVVGIFVLDTPVFTDEKIPSVTSLDFTTNFAATDLLE